ncbi:MAG: membrane protein insertase YidC [Desulfobulbus sp.]|nr:membrane protein insertase YidC [Desulfobulbus sp.]
MDLKRAFLAVVLSFLILVGYQYFFVKPVPQAPQAPVQTQQVGGQSAPANTPVATPAVTANIPTVAVDPKARDISIDTPLYTAMVSEQGGGIKSFVLKQYRNTHDKNSGPMQLITGKNPADLPVLFSLDNGAGNALPVFQANTTGLALTQLTETGSVNMQATTPEGLKIDRTMEFRGDSYLVNTTYKVVNSTDKAIQVSPALSLANQPFGHASQTSQYLFSGPAAYINGKLVETKPKKLSEGPIVLQGQISWTGYVDNYFITSVAPGSANAHTVTLQGSEKYVRSVVSEGIVSIPSGESKTFTYTLYFGPKKLKVLQAAGHDLAGAVNFGWFDLLAKPMLWLLNFFYQFSGNYGIAIILLTLLVKGAFWPITQKGMKSMKNMQKLQPKIAKLRERFKDDPGQMNQEMMALYKTYKVNPLGGCLPMVIQIPFFFALYRVLMAAIELRHAPFMLWITDLSAPDRLGIGFDLPYLHGIPVLTLLMGASMYLQQKMTPTTADPNQAKIMQFLPIVFTFMFLNFASGLVLYWFVNNLLSILQQYLINRQIKA